MHVLVVYEYSNGVEGVARFSNTAEAYFWIAMEGDHLIDYTIHFVG